jgi:hypothetical protein
MGVSALLDASYRAAPVATPMAAPLWAATSSVSLSIDAGMLVAHSLSGHSGFAVSSNVTNQCSSFAANVIGAAG